MCFENCDDRKTISFSLTAHDIVASFMGFNFEFPLPSIEYMFATFMYIVYLAVPSLLHSSI